MKATDLRDRNDAPISLGRRLASMGTVVVEGLMRAGGVVVRQVRGHEPEKGLAALCIVCEHEVPGDEAEGRRERPVRPSALLQTDRLRSLSTTVAALRPGRPLTYPPGWLPLPQR